MGRIRALLAGAALGLAFGGVWSGVARSAESLPGRVAARRRSHRSRSAHRDLADAMGAQDSALYLVRDTDDLELFRAVFCAPSSRAGGLDRPGRDGAPTGSGAALPTVSADELTWTFHLRPGIRYAPPLEGVGGHLRHIVRALERYARLRSTGFGGDGYAGLGWSVIRGFDAYAARRADAISGLETPDRDTLVVRLTRPRGDLDTLFSAPVTAPLPPSPGEVQGAVRDRHRARPVVRPLPGGDRPVHDRRNRRARPHRDRPRPSVPSRASRPTGASCWCAIPPGTGRRMTFAPRTRTASRSTSEAPSRGTSHGSTPIEPTCCCRRTAGCPPRSHADYLRHPGRGRVVTTPNTFIGFVGMNLAQPPFDDIHVRRAVAWAINRRRLQAIDGGPLTSAIATHVAPDAGEDNLLLHYDPFRTAASAGAWRGRAPRCGSPATTGTTTASVTRRPVPTSWR